jgi:hypothetical protein
MQCGALSYLLVINVKKLLSILWCYEYYFYLLKQTNKQKLINGNHRSKRAKVQEF